MPQGGGQGGQGGAGNVFGRGTVIAMLAGGIALAVITTLTVTTLRTGTLNVSGDAVLSGNTQAGNVQLNGQTTVNGGAKFNGAVEVDDNIVINPQAAPSGTAGTATLFADLAGEASIMKGLTSNGNVAGTARANVFTTRQQITPVNEASALDLYQSKTGAGTRNAGAASLRVSRNGSPYAYDYYQNGGVYQSVWLVLSGLTTGSGDTFECKLPAEDLSMLAIQSDVAGAGVQINSLDGISPVLEVVEGNPASVADPQLTSTKYNFAIGPNGALYWGNTARLYNTGGAWTVAVSTNVCTIDTGVAHGFVVGAPCHIRNFTVNTFVNNMTVTVTAVAGTAFSFALTHADQGATVETATGAELKGRYDVGFRRTGAGTLALTNGGTGAGTSLTATLIGNVTGDVTGNCSGSSGSCTGNAATATTATTATNITLGTTRPYDYILIQERQNQNTSAGGFTSGAWRTRALNTELNDTGNHASVGSSQITLAAGTYECNAWAIGYQVNRHQTRLFNITDNSLILTGSSAYATAAGDDGNMSVIQGRFTIAAQKVIELQHQCLITAADTGMGLATNFGVEVYSSVELRRVGP